MTTRRKVAFIILPFDRSNRVLTREEERFWHGQWMRRLNAATADETIAEHGLTPFEAPEAPFTGLYVLGFFRDAGWETEMLDCCDDDGELLPTESLLRRIDSSAASALLFSPFTTNYLLARSLLQSIKAEFPDLPCVAGGHHVSALPEEALADGFDMVVPGRAESGLEAMAQIGFGCPGQIPAALYRAGDGSIAHAGREGLARGADLPLPAYETLPQRFGKSYYARLFTSHGCPFRCAFCSSRLWTGMKPRYKAPARVRRELELIQSHVDFNEIYVGDETFTVDRRHALEVASLLHETGLVWGAETRIDVVDDDLLDQLGALGCREMDFGLESTSPKILRLCQKKIDPGQAASVFRAARRAGIRTHVNLMIGLPGETADTARATIDKICEWMSQDIVTTVDYFITVPYPGSDLFESPGDHGIHIRTLDWTRYREDNLPVYDLETLNAEQIYQLWREGLARIAEAAGA